MVGKSSQRRGRLLIPLVLLAQAFAASATTPAVSQAYQYLDNRGPSNTGLSAGNRTVFGASNVVPNGNNGTTGTAGNPAYLSGAPQALFFQAQIVGGNEFAGSLPAATAPRSAWTLDFANAGDHTIVTTPDIFAAATVGFARNVTISGASLPTLSWLPAQGDAINAVRLNFYDLDRRVDGLATLFQTVNLGSATASSYTVPARFNLTAGTHYSVEISLIQTRDHTGDLTQSNLLSRSRSFFDFVLLDQAAPGSVYLPTVTPATADSPYRFTFNISGVSNTATTFIDPDIAVGYDYRAGAGNPNFSTVLLPNVGDGLYDLSLWDGSAWVFSRTVRAGEVVDLGAGGVAQFRISGIETSANLSPTDGTAFVTGLTFSGSGDFTGTMTPITVAIPEPHTWALMAVGVVAVLSRFRPRPSNTRPA